MKRIYRGNYFSFDFEGNQTPFHFRVEVAIDKILVLGRVIGKYLTNLEFFMRANLNRKVGLVDLK